MWVEKIYLMISLRALEFLLTRVIALAKTRDISS